MEFCPECENLLYPKQKEKNLFLVCNFCGYKKDMTKFKKEISEEYRISEDINHFGELEPIEPSDDFFCIFPFRQLIIGGGLARYCCFLKRQYNFNHYDENEVQSVDELWNSPHFVEARQMMLDNPLKMRLEYCAPYCIHYEHGAK